MSRSLFLPSRRQALYLAGIAAAALACGSYLRYGLIEQSSVGIACESAGNNWVCAIRRTAISLYMPSAFGIGAMGAALLNLLRPSLVLCAIALFAGGIGIVLYNVVLSAFAGALLCLSLARPAPERV
jgi:hypothetical protein